MTEGQEWKEDRPAIWDDNPTDNERTKPVRKPDSREANKQELLKLFAEEQEILKAVTQYPHYDEYHIAEVSKNIRLINNPDFIQSMSATIPTLQGVRGYKPLNQDEVAVELSRCLNFDDTPIFKELPNIGVHTDISLIIGVYGDQATLEQMLAYVQIHPEFKKRLLTAFHVDNNGNAIKRFYVPKGFSINEPARRLVIPNEVGDESIVFDNLLSRDAEVMSLALHTLRGKIPKN